MNYLYVGLLTVSLLAAGSASAETSKSNVSDPEVGPKVEGAALGKVIVGPALPILEGTVGVGADVSLLFKAGSVPLYVGLDIAYYHWNEKASSGSASAEVSVTSIPIMATAIYYFELEHSAFRPYAGLGLGLSINKGKYSLSIAEDSLAGSASTTTFAGFVRPGVEIDLSQSLSLSVEPKLGLVRDSFVFAPTVGLGFGF